MGKKLIPWDEYDDYGELCELIHIVDVGWDWEWPGWPWVAVVLNMEYNNNRTANACRLKYEHFKRIKMERVSNEV